EEGGAAGGAQVVAVDRDAAVVGLAVDRGRVRAGRVGEEGLGGGARGVGHHGVPGAVGGDVQAVAAGAGQRHAVAGAVLVEGEERGGAGLGLVVGKSQAGGVGRGGQLLAGREDCVGACARAGADADLHEAGVAVEVDRAAVDLQREQAVDDVDVLEVLGEAEVVGAADAGGQVKLDVVQAVGGGAVVVQTALVGEGGAGGGLGHHGRDRSDGPGEGGE